MTSLDSEREFHDKAFTSGARMAVAPFYSIVGLSKRHYRSKAEEGVGGLDVLEYGCGRGSLSFHLAASGGRVTGIDISEVAIELCSSQAAANGVDIDFRVMDAHAMDFADDSFDRVCGSGILHHLELDRAMSEVSRVLRPGGEAIFFEPLGHNPLINWYRRRTPHLRTPHERPLLMSDLHRIAERFHDSDTAYFHLTGLAFIPFRRTAAFQRLVALADGLDRVIFSVPGLSRMAWIAVITLSHPKK